MFESYGHETFGWCQLYANDPDFAITYQMLVPGIPVANFHLQDGLLCQLGHLCVPSSDCPKLIWESHYSWVAGHFGMDKAMEVLQKYFIVQNSDGMSVSISYRALPMPSPNQLLKRRGCTHPYRPLTSSRSPSQWITCPTYHQPSMEMTVFFGLLISALRCPF